MKVKNIKFGETDFPSVLGHIPSPPRNLYVIGGDLKELLEKPRLAVVGSRKVTPYGKTVTYKLAHDLAGQGVVIISGLAHGIDGIAHQAALDAGGLTIAVLACGLDHIYPAAHRGLADRLLQNGGAIISEYPEGTEPLKQHFIARNRLISGLAEGTLIPEAAEKSGSLHTARFALEQGSTVMAVPGNITSPMSVGTNNLIRAGATPVTNLADIIAALNWKLVVDPKKPAQAQTKEEQAILDLLKAGTTEGSELQIRSGLSASLFNQTLTMLEITGQVRPLGANNWMLV